MTLEEILQQSELDRMLSGNVRPYQNHEISAYKPTFQERAYDAVNKYVSTPAAQSLVGNKGNFGLMDLTGLGGAAEQIARNTGRGINQGNYGDVALGFGLLGLDVAPIGKVVKPIVNVGKPIVKAIKKKISGAPYGITSKAKELAARKKYLKTVETGASGADWYNEGGEKILFLSGGNKEMANKVSENLAITSAGTAVSPNLSAAIKGHNQAIAGMPVSTGRWPTRMGKEINEVYNANKAATGQKRAVFADQIAIGGGFHNKPAGQGHRAVHDIWDGRAWNYTEKDGSPIKRGFSSSEHNWMDRNMDKVVEKLNKGRVGGRSDWNSGNAQAASWTGAKINAGKVSPKDAAFNYKQAFPQNYAVQSREAVTGKTTGHLKGLIDSPIDIRQTYTDEVNKIIYDKQGRDKISKGLGLLTDKATPNAGLYEGQFNPGISGRVAVGREKGSTNIDAASKELLDKGESMYGLLTSQDAAAWHTLAPTKVALKNSDTARLAMPEALSEIQAKKIDIINQQLMKKYNLKFSPIAPTGTSTGTGVDLLNLAKKNTKFSSDFPKIVKDIGTELNLTDDAITFGTGSRGYILNSEYIPILDINSKSKIVESFDEFVPDLAKKINELDASFGKEYNFDLSPVIITMRKALSNEGTKGLAALIAAGAIPTAVADEISPFVEKALAEEKASN